LTFRNTDDNLIINGDEELIDEWVRKYDKFKDKVTSN